MVCCALTANAAALLLGIVTDKTHADILADYIAPVSFSAPNTLYAPLLCSQSCVIHQAACMLQLLSALLSILQSPDRTLFKSGGIDCMRKRHDLSQQRLTVAARLLGDILLSFCQIILPDSRLMYDLTSRLHIMTRGHCT